MDNLVISSRILDKLKTKHNVPRDEIVECFTNVRGRFLLDLREDHQTDPPTEWFVSETNMGRLLKIAFMHDRHNNKVILKSAFTPEPEAIRIYNTHAVN